MESVKAVLDLVSPVIEKVLFVNDAVKNDPAIMNKSPEDEGWIAEVSVEKPEEIDTLLEEEAYKKHCEEYKDKDNVIKKKEEFVDFALLERGA